MSTKRSIVEGPTRPPLLTTTLGQVTDNNEKRHAHKTFLYSTHQKRDVTYAALAQRSRILATALLSSGLKFGDHIGIFLPSCVEHIELFLAAARIGLPIVSFNLTFTADELAAAAAFTDCKAIFICSNLGPRSVTLYYEKLLALPKLQHLVQIGGSPATTRNPRHIPYSAFERSGTLNATQLNAAEALVQPTSILNIQFTSGTTGAPKAAQLTHHGMLNNARSCGDFLSVTGSDRILSCPPLFHCMGSIGGFLNAFLAGASLIFPSPLFDPSAALSALIDLNATVMNAVPTMFLAISELAQQKQLAGKLTALRTGFIGGAPASKEILVLISSVLGMQHPAIGYGITEVSMGACGVRPEDSLESKIGTCGNGFPHVNLRVVDPNDPSKTLPINHRGELLVNSYGVFQGYYKQPAKTAEAIFTDPRGQRWFRTGDEARVDERGYLTITGRIKDIIIRGGENIYPLEIENRLAAHPAVAEACVVGVPDRRYGEAVAAFLRPEAAASASASASVSAAADNDAAGGGGSHSQPKDDEAIRQWVREKLGRHKAPQYVFWLGERGLPAEYPKTGSGKHQKHVLREMAIRVLDLDARSSAARDAGPKL